jgi:hypothetical protein
MRLDSLLALKGPSRGEDSYRTGFWSGLFGGFLPTQPASEQDNDEALLLGRPPMGPFWDEEVYDRAAGKAEKESLISPGIPGLKTPGLYG